MSPHRRDRRASKRWIAATAAVALAVGTATASVTTTPAAAAPKPGQADREVVTPIATPKGLSDNVQASYVKLHYKSPYSTMKHPESCDWIGYIRYKHKKGPKKSQDADAVTTMQPGLFNGATIFDTQARQVVETAAAKGKYVEYIAMDRRANCAEDRTGWVAAQQAGDYHVAGDYYFRGKAVGGKKYRYQSSLDLAYMSEYGLPMHMDDWRAIIEHVLPTPQLRLKKSYCGGHSLGGFLVGPMMAWDFDQNRATKDDAGYRLCGAGQIVEDGMAMSDPVGLSGTGVVDQAISALGGPVNNLLDLLTKNGLAAGQLPIIGGSEVLNTYLLAGMAASQKPTAESDLKKIVPMDLRTEPWMRLFYSRDYLDVFTGANLPRDLRLTNQAMLADYFDNNSPWIPLQAGTGFFDCQVTGKSFPVWNGLASAPILGIIFGIPMKTGMGQNYSPTDKNKLCGWKNYDQMPEGNVDGPDIGKGPITDQDHEPTDINDFARAHDPGLAPTDAFELYQPLRLVADLVVALTGGRSGGLKGLEYRNGGIINFLLHPDTQRWISNSNKVRSLNLMSENFPLQNASWGSLLPYNQRTIFGYHHYDMITASPRTNSGVDEPVASYVANFMIRPLMKG